MTDAPVRQLAFREQLTAMRRDFLDQLPARLEEMERWHAVLVRDHTRQDAIEALYLQAHKLFGAGATFGSPLVSRAAHALERALMSLIERGATPEPEEVLLLAPFMASLRESTRVAPTPSPGRVPGEGQDGPLALRAGEDELVFLVEDDEALALELSLQIGFFGYRVQTFTSLGELPAAVRDERPSALIMDIVFPEGGLAGPEMIARLRAENGALCPVLFISARADLPARLSAVRGGAEAYFTKPVAVSALVDKLDELTQRRAPEPIRVLVIEGPSPSGSCAAALSEPGIRVEVLRDPLQLDGALTDFKPDVLLVASELTGCSGNELVAAIRQEESHVGIPVVFLLPESGERGSVEAKDWGDEVLTTPVEPRRLVSVVRSRAARSRAVRNLMVRDSLTGLLNHTHVLSQLEVELSRAVRHRRPLSFVMLDLDGFKHVNDRHGHATGDRVLKTLARLLQKGLRRTDIVGRYGGEEFAVILPDTDGARARVVLDDLRASFSRVSHRATSGEELFVTFSVGIATLSGRTEVAQLAEAADSALYEAKRNGRNLVVVARGPDVP